MESLLGGVEEERKEESYGEEETLKATSDNKHEEEPCEPKEAAVAPSTSPNTDVTSSVCPSDSEGLRGPSEGPEGPSVGPSGPTEGPCETQNTEGPVTSDPAVQDPEAQNPKGAEVRNSESSPNPEPSVGDRSDMKKVDVCAENERVFQKDKTCENSERISGSETGTEVSKDYPDKAVAEPEKANAETNVEVAGPSSEPKLGDASSDLPNSGEPSKQVELSSELTKPAELSSELANLFSGELPSVSELQLLLPGVIQV